MELKYKAKNVYKEGTDREQINSFCEGYKSFLNSCRTERLCAEQAQKSWRQQALPDTTARN